MSSLELTERAIEQDTPTGLWRDAWRRVRRNPGAIVGAVIIAIFVVVAIFAPLLAPYDPREQNLLLIGRGCCPGPSLHHPLGVDDLGRDELSRLIYGARFSLLIGIVAVSVGLTLGLLFGSIAGYFKRSEGLIMRLTDIMLAIPGFLMAIGIVALFGGGGLLQVMLAIGIINVPIFTRLMRGSIIGQREADYVLAARSIGVPNLRILRNEVLHRDHRRCRPRLPRPRLAGSGDAGMGHDADGNGALPADGALPRDLPRRRDRPRRDGLQPRRRRTAGSPRSETAWPCLSRC